MRAPGLASTRRSWDLVVPELAGLPVLARPRVQRWDGALHDVPLQWPALVAGLVRAAAAEAATALPREGVPA